MRRGGYSEAQAVRSDRYNAVSRVRATRFVPLTVCSLPDRNKVSRPGETEMKPALQSAILAGCAKSSSGRDDRGDSRVARCVFQPRELPSDHAYTFWIDGTPLRPKRRAGDARRSRSGSESTRHAAFPRTHARGRGIDRPVGCDRGTGDPAGPPRGPGTGRAV